MSQQTYFTKIGAAQVRVPYRLNTTLPDLSGSTTLTFYASAANSNNLVVYNLNEDNAPLDPTATYYVMLALLGEDRQYGGLTYSAASPFSGPITVTSNNPAITINIPSSAFPANMTNAYAMGVFLSKNNTNNFALVQYDIIDRTGQDFDTVVICEPVVGQTTYPASALQTNVANLQLYPELGYRAQVYGCGFGAALRTEGGVTIQRVVGNVTVNADNSTPYPERINAGTTITFSVLGNDLANIIGFQAGTYGKVITPFGHTVEIGHMSLQTAIGFMSGNIPYQLIIPIDGQKVPEVRYYLASTLVNPVGNTEGWQKDRTNPIHVTVVTSNQDPLLNNVGVEIIRKYRA